MKNNLPYGSDLTDISIQSVNQLEDILQENLIPEVDDVGFFYIFFQKTNAMISVAYDKKYHTFYKLTRKTLHDFIYTIASCNKLQYDNDGDIIINVL